MRTTTSRRRRAPGGWPPSAVAAAACTGSARSARPRRASPRGTPDSGRPGRLTTRTCTRFVSPDKRDTVKFVVELDPVRGPTAARTSNPFAADARYNIYSTTTATPVPTHHAVHVQEHRQDVAATRSCTTTARSRRHRREPTVRQNGHHGDVGGRRTMDRESGRSRGTGPGRPASMPNYHTCATRRSPLPTMELFCRPGRRPVLPRPSVFDLLYGGNLSEVGRHGQGLQRQHHAVQVPMKEIALKGDPVATGNRYLEHDGAGSVPRTGPGSSVQTGDWVQVSRLVNPLVNEVSSPLAEGHVQRNQSRSRR